MLPPSVALVHDYLLVRRGAERTFEAIAECWPEAPIYTLLYDREGTEGRFAGRESTPPTCSGSGSASAASARLLPAFPRAAALAAAEVATTSSSPAAAPSPTPSGSATARRHVCYCHSPFRYAWFESERALGEVPRAAAPGAAPDPERDPPRRPLAARNVDPLRRQLGDHPRADPQLLGPRLRASSTRRSRSSGSANRPTCPRALPSGRHRAGRPQACRPARSRRRRRAQAPIVRGRREGPSGRDCRPSTAARRQANSSAGSATPSWPALRLAPGPASCPTSRSSGSPPSRRRRPAGRWSRSPPAARWRP